MSDIYKIDLSSSAGAQLLDICRYAPCTEVIIRCAAVIDTPLPAGADDTQANALLTLQSEAITAAGWRVIEAHINLIPQGDVNTLRVTATWQPDARKEES